MQTILLIIALLFLGLVAMFSMALFVPSLVLIGFLWLMAQSVTWGTKVKRSMHKHSK